MQIKFNIDVDVNESDALNFIERLEGFLFHNTEGFQQANNYEV